jgi:CelD/BcsL family acetyltransferase involved in cellulose biosynthesis
MWSTASRARACASWRCGAAKPLRRFCLFVPAEYGWVSGRANVAWTSPYVTNATPLVATDALPETIDALLDAMASAAPFRFWMIPLLALDSPVAAALRIAMERRGWPFDVLSGFERPALTRRRDYDAYARAHLKPNRRKGLARRRRRLAEQGRLAFESITDEAGLTRAVESYLALELRGWKGARGTALASRHPTAAFAHSLFGRCQDGGVGPRADILSLDGRPIAVSLALVCGGAAHLLKTAYDESLRALAPGLVLEDEIIRALHATAFADGLDTASVAGTVLDEIYGDRIRMGDLILAADARTPPETFAAIVRREAGRRAALKRLKGLAGLLRR